MPNTDPLRASTQLARLCSLAALSVCLSSTLACSSDEASFTEPNARGGAAGSAGSSANGGDDGEAGAPSNGDSSSAGSANNGGSSGGGSANNGGSSGGGSANGDAWWKPQAGLTWQWQLSEPVGTPLDVDVYDIDWEADEATVAKLHERGIKVICYVSVGSWEEFRPDANDFPSAIIGKDYDGWPGEKYVDIRSEELRAIMSKRFDVCREKGFDAIEPDNQDVYDLGADSGFPLTRQDGVEYARWLADEAHARGMGIGQKNAPGLTRDLVDSYDWALTESCYSDGDWCSDVDAYVKTNKPVFMCEYAESSYSDACSAWKPKGFSPILKNMALDAAITFCP
jgi:Glycoside-hydrolase family GH114